MEQYFLVCVKVSTKSVDWEVVWVVVLMWSDEIKSKRARSANAVYTHREREYSMTSHSQRRLQLWHDDRCRGRSGCFGCRGCGGGLRRRGCCSDIRWIVFLLLVERGVQMLLQDISNWTVIALKIEKQNIAKKRIKLCVKNIRYSFHEQGWWDYGVQARQPMRRQCPSSWRHQSADGSSSHPFEGELSSEEKVKHYKKVT